MITVIGRKYRALGADDLRLCVSPRKTDTGFPAQDLDERLGTVKQLMPPLYLRVLLDPHGAISPLAIRIQ